MRKQMLRPRMINVAIVSREQTNQERWRNVKVQSWSSSGGASHRTTRPSPTEPVGQGN